VGSQCRLARPVPHTYVGKYMFWDSVLFWGYLITTTPPPPPTL
jgi:hypothetical protein